MQRINQNKLPANSNPQSKILLISLALILLTLVLGAGFLLVEGDVESPLMFPYLLPWIALTGVVVIVPVVYKLLKGRFNLFDPITFASWTYFLPVFVFGGLIFAAGLNQPFFVAYIDDPKTNLPLTYFYIVIGIAGLIAGYHVSFAAKIGGYFGRKLPAWDWKPEDTILPGLILLVIGFWFNITAFLAGIIGFQRVEQYDAFDNVQYFLSLVVLEGSFLLWTYIFQTKRRDAKFFLVLAVLIAVIPLRTVISGSRGGLFHMFIMVAMAYVFSGKKMKPKQSVAFAAALVVVIFLGMIYGTTFRGVKGSESRVGAEEYIGSAAKTVDVISSKDGTAVFAEALANLGERLENVSALAVVVSNYEKLAPYEAAYGLENNIWIYTWTAFVPRIVWQDKPIVSDARAFSELYFNYSENSFPVTTFGDLLRNFGAYGVPLGMLLLGFVLRLLYACLIENQPPSAWRAMAYFMLITRVSYEGFYGTIFPELIRALLIVVGSVLLIKFIARKS